MLVKEQDTIWKKSARNKELTKLDDAGDDKEYKEEAIKNSAVHTKEALKGPLASLYYLIRWKNYLKEKNI